MTQENPIEEESSVGKNESNNHARAIASQLRLADDDTLEEIGVDPDDHRDHFVRASDLRDQEADSE